MAMTPSYPTDLSSQAKARRLFKELRWEGSTPSCPRCRFNILYRLGDSRYKCKRCQYRFSDFTGTILGKLRLDLQQTGQLVWLFTQKKTANESAGITSLSTPRVYFFFTRIRECLSHANKDLPRMKKDSSAYTILLNTMKTLEERYRGISLNRLTSYIDEAIFRYAHQKKKDKYLFLFICRLLLQYR